MALPKILKNFDLFQDGESWLGQIASVTLPKLSRKMEDLQAGGMAGPVNIDLGQEKIELAFSANGLMQSALDAYAATSVTAVQLRFGGAYQQEDSGRYDAVEVVVRGRYSEVDFGEGKTATLNEHKYTMPCAYYKLSINGRAVIEIDLLANVVIVNGNDVTAAQRAAIGHW